MEIRILGPLEVERDGETLSLGGRKQRSVLAVLILHAGETVSTDRLIDALWGGLPPPSADTTLRSYVSHLRRSLAGQDEPMLRRTSAGYMLDVDDEAIDARRFERLVQDGRQRRDSGDAQGAVDSWTAALELWRGDALQEFTYDDFAQTHTARLTQLRLACAEDRFDVELELGRHDAIVGDLDAFSAKHPTRERALKLRMLALYRCGRQAEALSAYEQGRRHLADELGIDPSRELRELHQRIVQQDESLAAMGHPGRRPHIPPLRSQTARAHDLPRRPTSFIGRDRDLEEIQDALTHVRVVTLTGVGGVGKTRLALEAGHRLLSRYSDGVWFCELAPLGDETALIHGMATTLGVQQRPGEPMRQSLLGALRQRRSLLIMDNCEHLLEPVADLLEEIVRHCPTTDVLATSREAIAVEGEHARPVRSLQMSTDDASQDHPIRLFEDRARAVRPDFTLHEGNTTAIIDICHRLDGIPLAIELAAARIASLSPAQIAKRLEKGYHFLRSGRRTALDRHRTLHGTIDWSYALLSDPEKLLFDRLSVFAGGFTLEAAEEVCGHGLDLDIADGLAALVAKSMVAADVTGDEARYSMLETMRQYAQDRLAERADGDDILRAHATYFAGLFEGKTDFVDGDSERIVRRLFAELDNLRSAQAWARSSGDVDIAMRMVGAFPDLVRALTEQFGWAEDALALPGAEHHPLLPLVLTEASLGALLRDGDHARAEAMVARALEVVDDPDDPRRLWPLSWRAAWALIEGRLGEARHWNAEYLRAARANDELRHEICAYGWGSLIESAAGDHATAVDLAERGFALARNGSSAMQGWALYFVGDAISQSGQDHERALDCLDRSVALCRANEMWFWVGVALVSSASLRTRHGDPFEALRMFDAIMDHWRLMGDWGRQWVTMLNLIELFARLGSDDAAATLLAASETSATAAPVFGPQGERMAELRRGMAERLGTEAYAAADKRGRSMSDEDALVYAKSEVGRALEGHGVHG